MCDRISTRKGKMSSLLSFTTCLHGGVGPQAMCEVKGGCVDSAVRKFVLPRKLFLPHCHSNPPLTWHLAWGPPHPPIPLLFNNTTDYSVKASRDSIFYFLHNIQQKYFRTDLIFKTFKKLFISWHNPFKGPSHKIKSCLKVVMVGQSFLEKWKDRRLLQKL